MEWTVVGVLAVLIGIFISIMTPVIKLNKNLTELNCNLKALQEARTTDKRDNNEEHKEIWVKCDEHDKTLAEHDKRLTMVERERN